MITRSAGLYTGYMGFFCGNGYEGLTKELDATVVKQAKLLAKAFNRDVEIRFNSDRESGGAWLKNSLPSFEGNCQVGFTAGLSPIKPEDMTDDEYFKSWQTLPKELYISTYVKSSVLKNPNLANEGNPESRYCSLEHKTTELALAWLIENVDTDKIKS